MKSLNLHLVEHWSSRQSTWPWNWELIAVPGGCPWPDGVGMGWGTWGGESPTQPHTAPHSPKWPHRSPPGNGDPSDPPWDLWWRSMGALVRIHGSFGVNLMGSFVQIPWAALCRSSANPPAPSPAAAQTPKLQCPGLCRVVSQPLCLQDTISAMPCPPCGADPCQNVLLVLLL